MSTRGGSWFVGDSGSCGSSLLSVGGSGVPVVGVQSQVTYVVILLDT